MKLEAGSGFTSCFQLCFPTSRLQSSLQTSDFRLQTFTLHCQETVYPMVLSSLFVAVVSAMAISSVSLPSAARPKIVALGDSLTSGHGIGEKLAYPALLQDKIDATGLDFTIVNAGVSGDTSERALRRFERALD